MRTASQSWTRTVRAIQVGVGLMSLGAVSPAFATAPEDMAYWISMRGITEDGQPGFVSLSYLASGTYTVAFAGCHGRTYYLRSADALTVQASRSAGETVQIHRGEPGTAPQDAEVICFIQADQ